ncbi:MAG: DUF3306 domain-containing protein, partial [Gammaproteobacteria bacterium]|nr:DUF3306 domain-containing protein [Gammaproteobacteria bacterium]
MAKLHDTSRDKLETRNPAGFLSRWSQRKQESQVADSGAPLIPESPAEEPASDLPAESAATSGVTTSDLETADLAALDRADDYATPEGANEVSPADAESGEDLPEEPL